jgi:hypothetical protein
MPVLMAERIERPPSLFGPGPEVAGAGTPAADGLARARDGDPGGGPTLDDAVVGAWEGLAARVVVACPVCGGALRPHAAPGAVGGRCDGCATTLD